MIVFRRLLLVCISVSLGIFLMVRVSGQCNELVWADEFDYNGLPDSTKWSYEIGGSGWGTWKGSEQAGSGCIRCIPCIKGILF
jgi:hypothetical protein